jgi:hypothetical protein
VFLNLFAMKIEEGILLLASSKKKSLTVKEAVEIIELVSRDPRVIKEVLNIAENRGILKRRGTSIEISKGVSGFSKPKVKRLECESSCRRCGLKIKNCFYIEIDDQIFGPFGSECVQKIAQTSS